MLHDEVYTFFGIVVTHGNDSMPSQPYTYFSCYILHACWQTDSNKGMGIQILFLQKASHFTRHEK